MNALTGKVAIVTSASNWCIEIVEEKCNAKREAFGQGGLLNA
jgi:hypothetical protein